MNKIRPIPKRSFWIGPDHLVLYFVLALCFQAIIISVFTPLFETNDDAIMMLIACGFFTGEPSDALIFINPILGRILVYLYTALPDFNWYVLTHFAALFLAIAGISVLLKLRFKHILFPIGFLIVCIPILVLPQYTITAFLTGILGWMLLWHNRANLKLSTSILIAICLILSYWIRYHVFIFLVVLNIPFAVYHFLMEKQRIAFYVLASAILFFLGHQKLNEYYYQSTYQHGEVYAYQQAIDAFANRPVIIPETSFIELGIPKSSWGLLDNWFWIDTDIFTIKTIEELSGEIIYRWTIPKVAFRTLLSIWKEKWYLLLLLSVSIPFILFWGKVKKIKLFFYFIVLLTCLLLLYFAAFHKLPHRLFYSLMISQLLLLSINFGLPHFPNPNKFLLYLFPVLAFALILSYQISLKNQIIKINTKEAISYINEHPNRLFLIEGHGIQYEGLLGLRNPAQDAKHNIIPTNWVINTPLYQQIFKIHKIDNLLDIIEYPNTVSVNLDTMHLNNYLCEKEGTKLKYTLQKKTFRQASKTIPLYKVSTKEHCN